MPKRAQPDSEPVLDRSSAAGVAPPSPKRTKVADPDTPTDQELTNAESSNDAAASTSTAPAGKKQKKKKSVAKTTDTNTIPIHRGKFKLRYLQKHAFLIRRADPAVGLLVSCSPATETRAIGQLRSFADAWLPKLFPGAHAVYPDLAPANDIDLQYVADADDDDDKKTKKPRPVPVDKGDKTALFQMADTGSAGLLFLRFRNSVAPSDFVLRLFDYLAASPDKKQVQESDLSFCHRFLPMSHVASAATQTDIVDTFGPLLSKVDTVGLDANDAPATNGRKRSVAIYVEARNAPAINRQSLTIALGEHLPNTMCGNLKTPDVVILVSVFKSVAGMSIVLGHDYRRLHKFNIQKL
ncbi:hypothetical protein AMAG_09697 [Allomyces macrogynus ATCC 38327]|uniref:THUMP domain-containing protein n=1 Tax=Allomyces macrogynus (strain ATCC 38327) TaxID=578462 RepID=A0A0L0STI4_ALLM3|nr:hypothetical protein AMAG_09697 [Allomyces macrogynus ATCC 38327]|eukprot:KNE65715.1 hypothetical protein AMAG_09697 [Allomyces macrogynus ATCC 38327]